MINLLLGAPGAGKSYEAVVYHVLQAVQRGRKVVTNLPLVLAEFDAIQPGLSSLIELRTKTLAVKPTDQAGEDEGGLMSMVRQARAARFSDRAFSHVEDYADPWRDAAGMGVLYVIDECHFALPKGETARAVLEWYSMHRHFNVDVLLITQSHGKLHVDIKDLVQVVYRCRKATVLGRQDQYIRKVLDGVRGSEMAATTRTYNRQFFKLYRSHTQGVSVEEASPDDVAPFIVRFNRMKWGMLGIATVACLAVLVYWIQKPSMAEKAAAIKAKRPAWMVEAGKRAGKPMSEAHAKGELPMWARDAGVLAPPVAVASAPKAAASAPDVPEPFAAKGVHLVGRMNNLYIFALSFNGVAQTTVTSIEVAQIGYKFVPLTDCAGIMHWRDKVRTVICDAPHIAVTPSQANAQAQASGIPSQGPSQGPSQAVIQAPRPQTAVPSPSPKV